MTTFIPLLLILGMLCSGCGGHAANQTLQQPASFEDGTVFRLRHSGVLDISGRRFTMSGLLQLQPSSGRAKVLLMNQMGMKLLMAEIESTDGKSYKATPIFISPFLRPIPDFFDESMRCIFELYLAKENSPGKLLIVRNGLRELSGYDFYNHTTVSNKNKYTLDLFLNSISSSGS